MRGLLTKSTSTASCIKCREIAEAFRGYILSKMSDTTDRYYDN